jgi:hypothetical protein
MADIAPQVAARCAAASGRFPDAIIGPDRGSAMPTIAANCPRLAERASLSAGTAP